MTALSYPQLVDHLAGVMYTAARQDRDTAGSVTVDEFEFLAGVAARELTCLRAEHPQVVPWCLACGDPQCFVHCVYCFADCSVPPDDQRHLVSCPNVLHLWPACPDMMCARCKNHVGAFYTLDSTDTAVCVGCNALPEDPDQGP